MLGNPAVCAVTGDDVRRTRETSAITRSPSAGTIRVMLRDIATPKNGKGASDGIGPDREIRRIDFSVKKAKRVAPTTAATTTTSLRPERSSVNVRDSERDHGTRSDIGQKRGRDETKTERQNAVVMSKASIRTKTRTASTNVTAKAADDGTKMGTEAKRRRTKSVLTTCAVLDAAPLTAICHGGAGATTATTSAATATFISASSQEGTVGLGPQALDEAVSTEPNILEVRNAQTSESAGVGLSLPSHGSPFATDESAGPLSEDHQHQHSAGQYVSSSLITSESKTASASNDRQQVSETRPASVIRDHERGCESDVEGERERLEGRRGYDELEDSNVVGAAADDALIKVDTGRPAISPEQDLEPERDIVVVELGNERTHVMKPNTTASKPLGSVNQRVKTSKTNSAQARGRDVAGKGTTQTRVSKPRTDDRVHTKLNQPRADDMFERKKRDNNFQKGIDLTAHSTSRFKTSGNSSTRSQGTASSSYPSADSNRTGKPHSNISRTQTRAKRQPANELDRQKDRRPNTASHGTLTGKGELGRKEIKFLVFFCPYHDCGILLVEPRSYECRR